MDKMSLTISLIVGILYIYIIERQIAEYQNAPKLTKQLNVWTKIDDLINGLTTGGIFLISLLVFSYSHMAAL